MMICEERPGLLVGKLLATIETKIETNGGKLSHALLTAALDQPSTGIPRIFQVHSRLFAESAEVGELMCQFGDAIPSRLSPQSQSDFWLAYHQSRATQR